MRHLIIGNGAAGNAAAQAIRRRDPSSEITIVSDELHAAYYRPLLPYLLHDAPEAQHLHRDPLHLPRDVMVHLGARVRAVVPAEARVILDDGRTLAYDRLLIATGASPALPPIDGVPGPGSFVLRTLDDATVLKAAVRAIGPSSPAVIVGGGRIGTKVALGLRHLGLSVTIVEMLPWIVPQQLDAPAAEIVQAALQAQGIEMIFGRTVRALCRQEGRLRGVVLDDGTELAAGLVVIATGVRANADIARTAGLATRHGILVNRFLQTSYPQIYAAGDVVETADVVTGEPVVSGTWTNAVFMGQVAGENMAGGSREYPGAWGLLNAVELAGIPVISAGLIHPPQEGYDVHAHRRDRVYRKLVFRGGTLVGFILVGEVEGAGVYTALIRERVDVSPWKEVLIQKGTCAPFVRALRTFPEAYAA
ncbi:MAG: FAD-dependent oxidoreductase [Armatimonadota bacterium]|nr:FAD-dependent oxidoreductase [Armatimonadota bacterium]MDR7463797.1 FAD-dependent oxidoreductase [Armatimonadota bacterium]MDR7469457.1 FAD-dependent oxidoreductase [Armatimonadota bacterium]MDR7473837.1 FAD-dependent oxidoreductase [Armatimonadota bacterium]MDR7539104.1 FAD-dependent oxidoreductase [Armatimonadota bacterium]